MSYSFISLVTSFLFLIVNALYFFSRIAQDIYKKLDRNKYIIEDSMDQLYCEKCARFLADRYVEGTCPKCSYDVNMI